MTKEVASFGKGGQPIPDTVERFKDVKLEAQVEEKTFTPEEIHSDEELQSKLPQPTGYRMLILPFSRKAKTKGGILLAESTLEKERISTNVGFVVSLGPDAYKDESKFPDGAWCKPRDWVIFGRYAGARLKIEGGELRLLNDDEILAVIDNPEDIQSA
jgi:chaperonin GroES|tara:strand:+ start:827 stop:1300 length:474 start_codon:yes stop_codon:yes gene_type:complete